MFFQAAGVTRTTHMSPVVKVSIKISLSYSFKSLIFCFVFGACVTKLVVFFLCCRSYAIALQI